MKKIVFLMLFIACTSLVNAQYGWTKQNTGTNFTFYDAHFLNPNKGWAVGDTASIYQYNNGTWSLYRKGNGTPSYDDAPYYTIDCYNNNCFVSGFLSVLWKYDGTKWDYINHLNGYDGVIFSLSMTSTTDGWFTRVINSVHKVYKLSGNKFTLQTVPFSSLGYTDICFIEPNKGWVTGAFGSILKYTGTKWENQSVNDDIELNDIFMLDSLNGWTVGLRNIYKYDGVDWTLDYVNQDVDFNSVFFTDKKHGWAVGRSVYWGNYGDGVIYFYDGVSWKKQSIDSSLMTYNTLHSVFFTDSMNGWAVGKFGMILHTQTGGKVVPVVTTNPVNLSFGNVPKSQQKDLSCNLKGIFLTGSIKVTAPEGFQVKEGNGSYSSALTVSKTSDSVNTTIYVRFSPTAQKQYTDTIKFSTPGAGVRNLLVSGNSMPQITLTPPSLNFGSVKKDSSVTKTFVLDAHNLAANISITAPAAYQVKTGTGSYASLIAVTKTADSANATVTVKFTPIQVKTYNDSISIQCGTVVKYLKLTASGKVSINKDPNNSLKVSCYPNPLKTATIISYNLPEYSFISLKVYNNTGAIIKELVNESQAQGSYEVQFEASSLPSGLYYYNLNTGLRSIWGKMMIMK